MIKYELNTNTPLTPTPHWTFSSMCQGFLVEGREQTIGFYGDTCKKQEMLTVIICLLRAKLILQPHEILNVSEENNVCFTPLHSSDSFK